MDTVLTFVTYACSINSMLRCFTAVPSDSATIDTMYIPGTRNLNDRTCKFVILNFLWVQSVTATAYAQRRNTNVLLKHGENRENQVGFHVRFSELYDMIENWLDSFLLVGCVFGKTSQYEKFKRFRYTFFKLVFACRQTELREDANAPKVLNSLMAWSSVFLGNLITAWLVNKFRRLWNLVTACARHATKCIKLWIKFVLARPILDTCVYPTLSAIFKLTCSLCVSLYTLRRIRTENVRFCCVGVRNTCVLSTSIYFPVCCT